MPYDLHRHLEGSHSPRALLDVARAHELRDAAFYDEARRAWRSEAELRTRLTLAAPSDDASLFYECIKVARRAYVSVEAIGELARQAFLEAAADTDGFEMRLSLFSMARTLLENRGVALKDVGPSAFADAWARPILLAVLAARDAAQRETGKTMLLRLGLSRTFESEPHYRALAEVVREQAKALVGLDVLGILPKGDPEPLQPELVRILESLRKDLPDLTIHAGEFSGHGSVDRTLELSPRGIGHGVHSLQSPKTLERLAKEGVTLEVCPTSNALLIPTALAKLEAAHGGQTPLRALQGHVHCVLGSDDPTPMGTSFRQELEVAREKGVDLTRLEADMQRRWAELTKM